MVQPNISLARKYQYSIKLDKTKDPECLIFEEYIKNLSDKLADNISLNSNLKDVGGIYKIIWIGSFITFKTNGNYIIKYTYYNRFNSDSMEIENRMERFSRATEVEFKSVKIIKEHSMDLVGDNLSRLIPDYVYMGNVYECNFLVYKYIDGKSGNFLGNKIKGKTVSDLGKILGSVNSTPHEENFVFRYKLHNIDNLLFDRKNFDKLVGIVDWESTRPIPHGADKTLYFARRLFVRYKIENEWNSFMKSYNGIISRGNMLYGKN